MPEFRRRRLRCALCGRVSPSDALCLACRRAYEIGLGDGAAGVRRL